MKRIENINLGGQAFIIDQDAYKVLDSYINNISRMLKKSKMKDELIDDIEFRISELMSEELGTGTIISVKHVNNVKKVMGDPRVFLNDNDHASSDYENSSRSHSGTRRKKRLYRNEKDKVLGGVASGLAAYFGIGESWIMRVAFLLTFFTIGFNVLIYVVLWAIIPAAVTEEDYAEMKGDAVNLDDIAESVKSEFEDLKKSF